MKILGLSCYYHDSAAALIDGSQILCAAQEERFTRIKGDESFPKNAIEFCLSSQGLTLHQIDAIVFYEKPLLKFERILETFFNICPRGLKAFLTAMPPWLQKKLNHKKLLRSEFKRHFNFIPQKIYFSEHHLSHAASAFYPSPYTEAAILCLDGVGEWATTSAWRGRDGHISPLWEIHFPHSLGLLYSAFTHYCGFKINSGEYKLMGLASFGKPLYQDLIKTKLIHLNSDGSYWMDKQFFGYTDDLVATNAKFEKLFSRAARKPEDPLDPFYMDIAASIQSVLNEAIVNLALRIKEDTGLENLCLAGGVALNCVSNGLLAKENIFKNIWVQPAAGDAGGALGAALAFYYMNQLPQPRRTPQPQDDMNAAYLGPEFSKQDTLKILKTYRLPFQEFDETELLSKIASLLADNKVIGWFQGRMEFGPRTLGSRSILGNPLDPNMQSKMNMKIKFREGFRPFAPIVTDSSYSRYFSLENKNEYMLFVSPVFDKKLMPSITHVDGTARVQTVFKEKNLRLHKLLEVFAEKTGHPVLINTSFNVRGEPIVCDPEDAIQCFLNTDIDALVLDHCLILKNEEINSRRTKNWHEQFSLD